jgi:glycine cleavage system H protein
MTTKYTEDHEWAKQDGDSIVVGITQFAQEQLGEIVFVELPDLDRTLDKGEEAAVIESVKAAGEIKSPMGGTVTAVNEDLNDTPEKVNEDPSGEGWVYKISPSDMNEFEGLMDEAAYKALVESLS